MTGYRFLGTTGDVTHCEHCGRDDLRRTVRVVALDVGGNPDGEPFYVGTTCAARFTGRPAAEVRAAVKASDLRREVDICNARDNWRTFAPVLDMDRMQRADWWERRYPECRGHSRMLNAYRAKGAAENAADGMRRVAGLYGVALPARLA